MVRIGKKLIGGMQEMKIDQGVTKNLIGVSLKNYFDQRLSKKYSTPGVLFS